MFRIRQSYREDVEQVLRGRRAPRHRQPAARSRRDRGHHRSLGALVHGRARRLRARVPVRARGPREEADHRHVDDPRAARHQRAPHIFFHVETDERYSETLDALRPQTLRIGYNYNGPTEIGGLILLPEYRRNTEALGKSLSYVRFLFMRMHRELFRDEVLSELLPPLEADGTSQLWEALGRQFTGLTYQEADRLSKENKEFIRALFPEDPIYTSLLPDDVRAIIGQVGPETRGVEKMLRRIGFDYAERIDPFDGGPHFIAKTDDISIVRDAKRGRRSARPTPTASAVGDHRRSSAGAARRSSARSARASPARQRRGRAHRRSPPRGSASRTARRYG